MVATPILYAENSILSVRVCVLIFMYMRCVNYRTQRRVADAHTHTHTTIISINASEHARKLLPCVSPVHDTCRVCRRVALRHSKSDAIKTVFILCASFAQPSHTRLVCVCACAHCSRSPESDQYTHTISAHHTTQKHLSAQSRYKRFFNIKFEHFPHKC